MESGEALLKQILLGGDLSDKIFGLDFKFDELKWDPESKAIEILESPGRDPKLKPTLKSEKVLFPKKQDLKNAQARGVLLHFFANHELLAIESMAYVLLRFPDAPLEFRKGVFRTLQDEQKHFGLYLSRMRECGVDIGTVPLNLYFWNSLKNMASPLDYVTQMSLTFEQANLDFALEYVNLFKTEIEDQDTATLLEEVHRDEVKHVAHGVKWFQKWKDPKKSDFDAYCDLLPFPMTPRRARGSIYFAEQSRRDAGMSESFIREVKIAGGSRGKVPDYYFFNPQCEIEAKLTTPPEILKQKIHDLNPLLLWLAGEGDFVEVDERPPLSWLEQIHEFRAELPTFVTGPDQLHPEQSFHEFKPWGYGESAWKRLKTLPHAPRVTPQFSNDLHREKLFSKSYWKRFLKNDGVSIENEPDLVKWLEEVMRHPRTSILKVSESTSGRGHQVLTPEELANSGYHSKMKKRIERGESFVAEPFYQKLQDFSVQYELNEKGELQEHEARVFFVDAQFQYLGAEFGKASLHPCIEKTKPTWREVHLKVAAHLKELGYRGPFGIDAMVAMNEAGEPEVIPVIEVNVRFTMGRVALAIEKAFKQKGYSFGILKFFNDNSLVRWGAKDFSDFSLKMASKWGDAYLPCTPPLAGAKTFVFALGSRHLNQSLMDEC